MFAMGGASRPHVLIVGNLVLELNSRLLSSNCEVYASDMRVLVNPSGLYTYPDVVVVCDKPVMLDDQMDTLTNPLIIIEVLSETTKNYDQGGKFHLYMRLPSLREYLTVSQTEMLVSHAVRQADGGWLIHEVGPENPTISLPSLSVEVGLADIYNKVPLRSPTSS